MVGISSNKKLKRIFMYQKIKYIYMILFFLCFRFYEKIDITINSLVWKFAMK